jgi:signal transduction histidine kinase
MNWMRDWPIRRKLTFVIMLTCGAVLLLTYGLLGAYQVYEFRVDMVHDTSVLADVLAKNTQAALAFQDNNAAQQTLQALQAEPDVTAACLYDGKGGRFSTYTREGNQVIFPERPEVDGHRFGPNSLVVLRPVVLNDRRIGTLYLQTSLEGMYDRLWLFAGLAFIIFSSSALVALVLSARLQHPISQPILALTKAAHHIAADKDFTVRVPSQGRDEAGLLTDAFNLLLTSIEERDQALRMANKSLRAEVAERKAAEGKVRQLNAELEDRVVERTAQLETANKELEAFSYSVSHDLRAPLRAVDGFSQAVLEDYGSQLPPEGQRDLQTIREGAQRMGTLIDDLLAFSRLSRAPLNKQPVNTDKLVRAVLEDLNSEREGRQIEIQIGELPSCQGDPALLKQVWTNLLSNAVKYTRHRNPAVIEIGCKAEQENVYFVRDNGVGFNMKYVHKLFGVFQRLHRADQFEGTGVGLAIVQRVIHRHGGRVWAEAALDHGATFNFTLNGGTKT